MRNDNPRKNKHHAIETIATGQVSCVGILTENYLHQKSRFTDKSIEMMIKNTRVWDVRIKN
jgi:hypothetical protein